MLGTLPEQEMDKHGLSSRAAPGVLLWLSGGVVPLLVRAVSR